MALGRTTRYLAIILFGLMLINLWIYFRYEENAAIDVATIKPSDNLFIGIHNNGYENSWLENIDLVNKLVRVYTIDSRLEIVFEAEEEFLNFLKGKVGWIPTPVTLTCAKVPNGDCDFVSPYNLFVSSRRVRAVAWRFTQEKQPFKAWVHHGPGDGDYENGLIVDFKNGKSKNVFMQMRTVDPESLEKISKVKREDFVEIFLPEDMPYKARVNGGEFDIAAISLSGH